MHGTLKNSIKYNAAAVNTRLSICLSLAFSESPLLWLVLDGYARPPRQ